MASVALNWKTQQKTERFATIAKLQPRYSMSEYKYLFYNVSMCNVQCAIPEGVIIIGDSAFKIGEAEFTSYWSTSFRTNGMIINGSHVYAGF